VALIHADHFPPGLPGRLTLTQMASSSKRPSRSSKKSAAPAKPLGGDADVSRHEASLDQASQYFDSERGELPHALDELSDQRAEAGVLSAETNLGEFEAQASTEVSAAEYAESLKDKFEVFDQMYVSAKGKLAEERAATTPVAESDDPSAVPPVTADPAATPAPDSEAAAEPTVLTANVGDQPSANDTLGFGPYVEAVASFLTNPQTRAPLTLSIEGEWGSGKSSFMLQLKNRLGDAGETTLDFNAWRHDKDDAMWAAFALEFVRKLSRQLPPARRWWAHLKLLRLRFDWQTGWRDIVRIFVFTLALLAVCTLPFAIGIGRITNFLEGGAAQQQQQQEAAPAGDAQAAAKDGAKGAEGDWQEGALKGLIGLGGVAGYFGVVLFLFLKLKDLIRNPLAVNLRQHVQSPDYNARVAFIEKFHEDFSKVVATYAGDRKVFVFIDDLDRCEVPKAADLMQALNLMISDAGQLVFIIGMDREKVAAGLAVKYEKLLPYLAPAPQSDLSPRREPAFDPVLGLEYGYAFIEKFIQLPFVVPQAGEEQLKDFLATISRPGERTGGASAEARPAVSASAARATDIRRGLSAERQVTENVELLEEILQAVAPAFEYNPRRLKQFINTFRLKTYIASRTGLFDASGDHARLTPYKLGKFVAISLRWPLLLADLDADRRLLSNLQDAALTGVMRSDPTDAELRWFGRKALRDLLHNDCLKDGGVDPTKVEKFGLSGLNVDKLLQVSPLTKTAAPPVRPSDPPEDKSHRAKGIDFGYAKVKWPPWA
jgi:hypothetical protein